VRHHAASVSSVTGSTYLRIIIIIIIIIIIAY
jgi:hypothetical protein